MVDKADNMKYSFSKSTGQLANVLNHLATWDIEVVAVESDGDKYTLETASPVPQEQLDHLELTEV